MYIHRRQDPRCLSIPASVESYPDLAVETLRTRMARRGSTTGRRWRSLQTADDQAARRRYRPAGQELPPGRARVAARPGGIPAGRAGSWPRSAAGEALGQVGVEPVDADPVLPHGVTFPDRHGLVVQRVEVDGHAVGSSYLVLAAVPAPDGAGVVELAWPPLAQRGGDVPCPRREVGVTGERENRDLDGSHPVVEPQHGPLLQVALGVRRLIFRVRVQQERQRAPVHPGRRLDHVGDVALAGVLVQVGHVHTGSAGVRGQVEVRPVGDALQLAPLGAGETEPVLDVDGALGVMRQLLLGVLVQPQVLLADAEAGVPVQAGVDPLLVPLLVGARADEELHLHLLELAGAEDEVPRRDLVAERLADLPDAERDLAPRGLQDVAVVDEDALRCLGPQVREPRFVLDGAEVGAQQSVEHAGLGELAPGAAVRAGQAREAAFWGVTVLRLVVIGQVVGAEPVVAGRALGQRVRELGDVPARLPDLPGENHAGVEAHDVVALGHHRAPPQALDVVLQLHAERPVVPGGPQAAVDLAGRVDEPPPLAEADDGVEAITASWHHNLHPAGRRRRVVLWRPCAGGTRARVPLAAWRGFVLPPASAAGTSNHPPGWRVRPAARARKAALGSVVPIAYGHRPVSANRHHGRGRSGSSGE